MSDMINDKLSAEDGGAVGKPAVSRAPSLIEWEEWHRKCAYGCCDEGGVEVWIDGASIGSRPFGDAGAILEMVLEHEGREVDVRRRYSDHG